MNKSDKDFFFDQLRGASLIKSGESFDLSGLAGSSKSYFTANLHYSTNKTILVVTADLKSSEDLHKDLCFFLGRENVLLYPDAELLPFDTQDAKPDIKAQRFETLYSLINSNNLDNAKVIVISVKSLLEKVPPREYLETNKFIIKKDGEYDRGELLLKLFNSGYEKLSLVEALGEFSVRGDIVDIFISGASGTRVSSKENSSSTSYPIRIEFFGDMVESIRTFDPTTQRSLRELREVAITPITGADLSEDKRFEVRQLLEEKLHKFPEDADTNIWNTISNNLRDGVKTNGTDLLLPLFHHKLNTLFDYLPTDTIITTINQPLTIDSVVDFNAETLELEKTSPIKASELYMTPKDYDDNILQYKNINLGDSGSENNINSHSNSSLRTEINAKKSLSPLTTQIKKFIENDFSVTITAHNRGQAERTEELLSEFNCSIKTGLDLLDKNILKETGINIIIGTISTGFVIEDFKIALISEEEIFGKRTYHKPPKAKKLSAFASDLQDLKEDDFIVHSLHGIGAYKGFKKLNLNGIENDFLILEYKDKDILYLPVQRMDLITKYQGIEGKPPSVDKLGSTGWEKSKKRTKKAIVQIAGELLKLYAQREATKGHYYSPPSVMFKEFEDSFEFTETDDQVKTLSDIYEDMESDKVMDRLVCGDVGYGKTEVAMRAAMRTVLEGKQVAVLVPTTILAQQHLKTFTERFAPFPVTVDIVSRFQTKAQQKETVEKTNRGKVDILIGTHRILQKDITFNNLGLIVIDEEQRFGVKHKEKLKGLKADTDVLTLTATPIPRTLHMSLADLRDLSIIATAPEDRLSISTRVINFDESIIKEAINRETHRGGQIFFVHNRVQTINEMAERLKVILPDLKIGIGHGQMGERDLEKVMLDFINKKYDLLLATTIIESGLDIPSANTIIINRADRFGLSELYQLRGRVGRSSHKAFAYLITPSYNELTKDAQKRMDVIKELSELGSGFRVAAFDLEIRGAGELLGSAQSGSINDIGFEMYTELLNETIRELKGETKEVEVTPEINLKVENYIPEDYVPDTRQRLVLYKRFATLSSTDELDILKDDIADRYGEMPLLVKNIFSITELKLSLKKLGAIELSQKTAKHAENLYLTFAPSNSSSQSDGSSGFINHLITLAKERPEKFRLAPDSKLVYFMGYKSKQADADTNSAPSEALIEPINHARYLLNELLKGC